MIESTTKSPKVPPRGPAGTLSKSGKWVILLGSAFGLGFWVRGDSTPRPSSQIVVEETDRETQFTCSMHPQVRLTDPEAKCPICFMDLIPAAPSGVESDSGRLALSEAARALARVETTPVARFFPTTEVRLYGKVTYDQTKVARITSYFSGRLDRLFVDFVGAPVRKGDHVADIFSPELLAAFEELRQAKLAVEKNRTASDLLRTTTTQTLVAAREKLRLFGLTPAQIETAEEGTMGEDRFTIFSPIGGLVTHLAALEGDYVETGSPIATVADLNRLWLEMEAYESQLPLLRWGQRVTFTVESHPGEVFEGRVSFIEPIVDDHTRTAAVRAAIDNRDGRLKPGMFATAVAETRVSVAGAMLSDELAGKWLSPMHPDSVYDEPGGCEVCGMDLVPAEELGVVGDPDSYAEPVVIPKSAVLVTGRRAVVYVRVPDSEDPLYEGREIVLGPKAGEFYVVREGLEEGEEVVTRGAFKIDSAMQIAAKPSMMMEGEVESKAARSPLPAEFRRSLEPLFAEYFALQEAMANDDLDTSLAARNRCRSALEAVKSEILVDEWLAAWRRAVARFRPNDEPPPDLEALRLEFESLSALILDVTRHFGPPDGEAAFEAYCPMAFDNRGAAWLQRRSQIENPYWGAQMLRCGEIRQEFSSPSIPPDSHDHD